MKGKKTETIAQPIDTRDLARVPAPPVERAKPVAPPAPLPNRDPIVIKVAAYWSEKTNNPACDFARLAESGRADVGFYRVQGPGGKRDLTQIRQALLEDIWHGYPLARTEWHLAIALELIPEQSMTYEQYYTMRWHETSNHRSYYSKELCPNCIDEQNAAKKIKKGKRL